MAGKYGRENIRTWKRVASETKQEYKEGRKYGKEKMGGFKERGVTKLEREERGAKSRRGGSEGRRE